MQLSDKMMMAVIILTLSYVLLFTEKLNRAVVAILGASLMIFAGVLTQESALAAVDFNTLALLIGMMTIVGIGEKSGMFQFVAIWSAQKVKARPRMLLMVLAVVTAGFSAFFDHCFANGSDYISGYPQAEGFALPVFNNGNFSFQHRRHGHAYRRSAQYSHRLGARLVVYGLRIRPDSGCGDYNGCAAFGS